tara:strand:- start:1560 stop:2486 length:927 start_codon:yes stop_codon:yes gene_type:complete
MIRPKDKALANQISSNLVRFSADRTELIGISDITSRETLVAQIIESIRRIQFIEVLFDRPIAPERSDPSTTIFDPLRAAISSIAAGEVDEAYWLIFLATHFSKHHVDGWGLMRAIYGALDRSDVWTWSNVTANPSSFFNWLDDNYDSFANLRFGNHRKYESKRRFGDRGFEAVFQSYLTWVGPTKSHEQKIRSLIGGFNNRATSFDVMYHSLDEVVSWGRLAKFDHLTMLGKLRLAPIEPGRAYLAGATGPRKGVALLLTGSKMNAVNTKVGEEVLVSLGTYIDVGQQVLEDSLCNWQKSPQKFIPFR